MAPFPPFLLAALVLCASTAAQVPFDLCSAQYQNSIANAKCALQMTAVCNRPLTLARMLDASSKLPSGLLEGNVLDFGSFSECVAIDEHVPDNDRILGKHCINAFGPKVGELQIRLAACIPDACTPADLLPAALDNPICQTKETLSTMDWADWTVTGVFLFILFLMVCHTVYDVHLEKTGKTAPHPVLISFSVLSNGRKIVATANSPDQLHCLNGIRFISMLWVIAGHRFSSMQAYPLVNFKDAFEWMDELYSAYLQGARVAVDTFFFLSAFLSSYMYFKNIDKKPLTVAKIPVYYIHRLLRITPALAALFFFQITIYKFFSSGPTFPAMYTQSRKNCVDYWWSFFFYFQNYYNPEKMCIIPTWYLSADMHMFLLSPLFILPMGYLVKKGKSKMAYAFIWTLIALATFVPMIIDFYRDKYNEYETHTRLSGYLVGIFMGMLVARTRDKKIRVPQMYNVGIWLFILAGMLAIVMCTNDVRNHPDNLKWNMFHTFSRPGWALGLSWVVWACVSGNGGVVNWLLSRSVYQVTGRLSYSIYLMHSSVITAAIGYQRTGFYFSDYSVIYLWCGDFIFTLLISILWVLAFESPMIGIEKFIFGAPRPKPKAVEDLA